MKTPPRRAIWIVPCGAAPLTEIPERVLRRVTLDAFAFERFWFTSKKLRRATVGPEERTALELRDGCEIPDRRMTIGLERRGDALIEFRVMPLLERTLPL